MKITKSTSSTEARGLAAIVAVFAVFLTLTVQSAIAAVGHIAGQATVSASGEATYNIPIVAPPGINGLTPRLALNYGHRQEEDMIGVGWGVSGLSAISRCAKTKAQDGAPNGVKLDLTDRFCLDGNQLRLTNGTYGAAGSTYRAEVDMMSRITANSVAGNGPAWFKVESKDGLIYEYGNSVTSRIESLAIGYTTTARIWALSKIRDRSGNEIRFTYFEDGAPYGDYRIAYVEYRSNPGQGQATAGYKINFVYENQPVGDVDADYAAGGIVQDVKRLTKIEVWYTVPNPDTLFRQYNLGYETNLSTASRSRLAWVEECAGTALDCFPRTNFTYQNGQVGLDADVSSGATIPANTKALTPDINGDGRADLMYSTALSAGYWQYRLMTSAGTYSAAQVTTIPNTGQHAAFVMDYNSDGYDDVLVPLSGGTWWAIRGSASGLLPAIDTTTPGAAVAGRAIAMDMNGDGREDLVYATNVGDGVNYPKIYVRYRLETGEGFSATPVTWFAPGSAGVWIMSSQPFGDIGSASTHFPQSRNYGYDVNGDGYRDIPLLIRRFQGGEETYTAEFILGGGAGGSILANSTYTVGHPIDFNGDGYTDLVYDSGTGKLLSRLSTGKTLAPAVLGPSIAGLNFSKAVARDWDNDGLEDLLVQHATNAKWYLFRSLGTSFAAMTDTTIASASPITVHAIDANGDAMHDIGYVDSLGVYKHRTHKAPMDDLLLSATDGQGNSATFTYAPLSDASVYTRNSDAVFPEMDFTPAAYVVKTAQYSTGIGGSFNLTYTYSGAQQNRIGRGLNGFDKRESVDSRDGTKITETYHRDFPYRGRIKSRDHRMSDNGPISLTTNTWSTLTGGTLSQTYFFPYISQSVVKNFEVTGAFKGSQLNEITTLFSVDDYGTPSDITTTTVESYSGNGLQGGATFTEQVVNDLTVDDLGTWCLGAVGRTRQINMHNQASGAQITRTVTRTWDTAVYCRVTQETVEPVSSTYKVTRAIGFDGFGNINSETVTGINMPARTTTTNWGTVGQFPQTVTNPLGQVTTLAWDYGKGVQNSQTDPNGLVVSWLYDNFGRRTRETRVDGTYTDITLTACDAANNYCGTTYDRVATKARSSSKRTNGTEIRFDDTYLDQLDRVVQQENQVLGGGVSRVRTIYDALGRSAQQSAPSFSVTPGFYTTVSYDVAGRPTQISRPIDSATPTLQNTIITYNGLTTITTDAEGKTSTKVSDALGRTLRSIDAANYYQQFEFDAFGSVTKVVDNSVPVNTLMEATYAYGIDAFKTSSIDLNMGSWTYTPNALGEVVGYTDAKGQNFTASFDNLSRPLTRGEPDNSTTWTWGTSAAAYNIGRLASIASSGFSETYTFDNKGRPSQRSIVTDTTYLINHTYDSTSGQMDSLQYPTSTSGYRLKVKYEYQYGVLYKVSDFAVPTNVYWQANGSDARGNVVDQLLGNGLQTVRGFDEVTGLPQYIQSGPGGSTARQDMTFLWNKVGSLTQRKDLNRSLTEDFFYDSLHRLDYSKLNNVQNLDLAYNAMGNITSKSDVGSYDYGTAQPGCTYHGYAQSHAVRKAGNIVYCYDQNGNQSKRDGQSVTWTSYNYPGHVPNGTKYHDYFYDAHRQRWKQVYYNGTASETTIFVGGILEKHTAGGVTEYRHYIAAGGQPVALYTRPTSGAITTEYFLLDHQGSVAEVTDSLGGFTVGESFAAFGERRDASDWSGPTSAPDKTTIAAISQRGYTFHTNLEESSLIHMNGRIADGLTGRFLSADPYVFQPQLTQGFNRYSYVGNNPLTYTDPSGYCYFICDTVIASGVSYVLGKLFGGRSRPPPPPNYCFIAGPSGCYGGAPSKFKKFLDDIFGLPPLGAPPVWGIGNGTWGSGECTIVPGCMNWGEELNIQTDGDSIGQRAKHALEAYLMLEKTLYDRVVKHPEGKVNLGREELGIIVEHTYYRTRDMPIQKQFSGNWNESSVTGDFNTYDTFLRAPEFSSRQFDVGGVVAWGGHINYIAVGMLAAHYGPNYYQAIPGFVLLHNLHDIARKGTFRDLHDIGQGTRWALFGAKQYLDRSR